MSGTTSTTHEVKVENFSSNGRLVEFEIQHGEDVSLEFKYHVPNGYEMPESIKDIRRIAVPIIEIYGKILALTNDTPPTGSSPLSLLYHEGKTWSIHTDTQKNISDVSDAGDQITVGQLTEQMFSQIKNAGNIGAERKKSEKPAATSPIQSAAVATHVADKILSEPSSPNLFPQGITGSGATPRKSDHVDSSTGTFVKPANPSKQRRESEPFRALQRKVIDPISRSHLLGLASPTRHPGETQENAFLRTLSLDEIHACVVGGFESGDRILKIRDEKDPLTGKLGLRFRWGLKEVGFDLKKHSEAGRVSEAGLVKLVRHILTESKQLLDKKKVAEQERAKLRPENIAEIEQIEARIAEIEKTETRIAEILKTLKDCNWFDHLMCIDVTSRMIFQVIGRDYFKNLPGVFIINEKKGFVEGLNVEQLYRYITDNAAKNRVLKIQNNEKQKGRPLELTWVHYSSLKPHSDGDKKELVALMEIILNKIRDESQNVIKVESGLSVNDRQNLLYLGSILQTLTGCEWFKELVLEEAELGRILQAIKDTKLFSTILKGTPEQVLLDRLTLSDIQKLLTQFSDNPTRQILKIKKESSVWKLVCELYEPKEGIANMFSPRSKEHENLSVEALRLMVRKIFDICGKYHPKVPADVAGQIGDILSKLRDLKLISEENLRGEDGIKSSLAIIELNITPEMDENLADKLGKTSMSQEEIIQEMISSPDAEVRDILFFSYPRFITNREFIEKLLEKYDLGTPEVRGNIESIWKKWLKTPFWRSLEEDTSLAEKIQLIEQHTGEKYITTNLTEAQRGSLSESFDQKISDMKEGKLSSEKYQDFIAEFSMDLMGVFAVPIKSLRAEEYREKAWTKPDKNTPNIKTLTRTTNLISMYVANMVISETDIEKRAKLFEFFIDICDHSLLILPEVSVAVMSGLEKDSIARLKKTVAKMTRVKQDKYKELTDILNPDGRFKIFKKHLKNNKLSGSMPLSSLLTDILFGEDGGKKDASQYSLTVLNVYSKVYQQIANCTHMSELQRNIGTCLGGVLESIDLSDKASKEMYQLSLRIEPSSLKVLA